jgi:hypothetical protein
VHPNESEMARIIKDVSEVLNSGRIIAGEFPQENLQPQIIGIPDPNAKIKKTYNATETHAFLLDCKATGKTYFTEDSLREAIHTLKFNHTQKHYFLCYHVAALVNLFPHYTNSPPDFLHPRVEAVVTLFSRIIDLDVS